MYPQLLDFGLHAFLLHACHGYLNVQDVLIKRRGDTSTA